MTEKIQSWPSLVNHECLEPYNYREGSAIIVEDNDVGSPKTRQRSTDVLKYHTFDMEFTLGEWEILKSFVRFNLRGGALTFEFPIPNTRYIGEMRLIVNEESGWFTSFRQYADTVKITISMEEERVLPDKKELTSATLLREGVEAELREMMRKAVECEVEKEKGKWLDKAKEEVATEKTRLLGIATAEVAAEKTRLLGVATTEVATEKESLRTAAREEVATEKTRLLGIATSEVAIEKARLLGIATSEVAAEKERLITEAKDEVARDKEGLRATAREEVMAEKERLLREARSDVATEKERLLREAKTEAEVKAPPIDIDEKQTVYAYDGTPLTLREYRELIRNPNATPPPFTPKPEVKPPTEPTSELSSTEEPKSEAGQSPEQSPEGQRPEEQG